MTGASFSAYPAPAAAGAPTGASYVTTAAEAGLSGEKVLGTDIIVSAAPTPTVGPAGALWHDSSNLLDYRSNGVSWVQLVHTHGTTYASPNQLPWRFDINPHMSPLAKVGTWTGQYLGGFFGGGYVQSDGAQNDSIDFAVLLAAGTWTVELMHRTSSNVGIYTAQLDDGAGVFTTLGTIDGYAASAVGNVLSSIAGVSVGSTARRTFRLLMGAKNASSSSYFGGIQWLMFRRTA